MWSYSKAGVDIKKIREIQDEIGLLVSKIRIGKLYLDLGTMQDLSNLIPKSLHCILMESGLK